MGIRELFLRLSERLDVCDAAHNYTCDLCGREVFENERICKSCRAELPKIERCCPFCGRRVREEGVCLECKKQPLTVEKARSCYSMRWPKILRPFWSANFPIATPSPSSP